MMGVPLVYSGLLALTLGFLSVGKPLRPFGISTRRRGGVVVASGALLIACVASSSWRKRRIVRW